MKFKIKQAFNLILFIFLTNTHFIQAHDSFNGGCNEHCGQKVKLINNKNKLKNYGDQINIEKKNSCLNKSLCRG